MSEKKHNRPVGHPPYKVTEADRKKVRILASLGMRQVDIAAAFEIDLKTLRKYYREELDDGKLQTNSAVARSLYNMATDSKKPQVAAAIFWLKCQAGWKDQESHIEQSAPISIKYEVIR